MSTQTSYGYADSAIAGYVAKTLTLAPINFGVDWRVSSQSPNEVILTDLTAPLDQPETIRLAFTPVADIYKNTGIEMSNRLASKAGVSIVCQHNSVMKITESTDPTYNVLVPMKEHIVLVVPVSAAVTPEQIITNICRMTAGLFETGQNSTTRLKGILRGSLVPSDL